MNKPKIYVFRISKGNEAGNPLGKCPLDYGKVKKIIKSIDAKNIQEINYENNGHLNFIFNELWKKSTLRQGWGIRNLDLQQGLKKWIENYMLSGKIYWNTDISCDEAKGRWNIIQRMLTINKNDFLIIPKTSSIELNDYSRFIVCQVKEEYFFDYPIKIKDFGHCLKVKNIKEFRYNDNTLLRSDFGTPYLWAITEVKEYHNRFEKFRRFIENNYNIKMK